MEQLDLKAIGNRIALERQRLGYTQRDLAVKCDLGLKTISLLENGQRILKVETLVKLSQCFNRSVDFILFGRTSNDEAKLICQLVSKISPKITGNIVQLLETLAEENSANTI